MAQSISFLNHTARKASFKEKLKMTAFDIAQRIYLWWLLRRVMKDLKKEAKQMENGADLNDCASMRTGK